MKRTCLKLMAIMLILVAAFCDIYAVGEETDRIDLENNIVFFGTYPQTTEGTDRTPVEWIILEKSDKAALLLSKYALDVQPFNTNFLEGIYWDNCSLRKWMNEDFLNDAFSAEEQEAMYVLNVDNSISQGRPNGGNTSVHRDRTKDAVFLLSYYEAFEKYFKKDEDRVCLMTDYVLALNHGKVYKKKSGKGIATWWLRSPIYPKEGMIMTYMGTMLSTNNPSRCEVRPAIIINLKANVFK